jgi:hypothetical protein
MGNMYAKVCMPFHLMPCNGYDISVHPYISVQLNLQLHDTQAASFGAMSLALFKASNNGNIQL